MRSSCLLSGGNRDNFNFASNLVDWLADDIGLASIRARDTGSKPLDEVGEGTKTIVKTVNLAARLVGAADASTVAVSDSLRTKVGGAFRFEALAPRELKGFGDPVTFYRAGRR